jgi:hypothetical protein
MRKSWLLAPAFLLVAGSAVAQIPSGSYSPPGDGPFPHTPIPAEVLCPAWQKQVQEQQVHIEELEAKLRAAEARSVGERACEN